MSSPKTMFQLSGRVHAQASLSNATLIIIDAQNEYLSGPLQLTGVTEALANISLLVEKARAAKCPIVHIRHLGTVGGLFDPQGDRGKLVEGLEPVEGEYLVDKRLPNAFNDTGLHELLQSLGRLDLIICGFMTHSSISTTVRTTKDYGYRCTLVDDACATRDLPVPGGIISAEVVHRTEMAILADNFATLALTHDLV